MVCNILYNCYYTTGWLLKKYSFVCHLKAYRRNAWWCLACCRLLCYDPWIAFSILTYLLTYSMVKSTSWEANWFAASQEIPRISGNPKVHYRTHKRPPPVCILGQPNPVHIPTSHLLELHPNIIQPSTPRFPQWSPYLRFPYQDPIHHTLHTHTRHMPSPSHSSRFYDPHNIGWAVQITELLVMQSPPFPRYLVPPRSKYSPQHHVLFSNTLRSLYPRNVSDQLSYF